jgi:hypothetical protein
LWSGVGVVVGDVGVLQVLALVRLVVMVSAGDEVASQPPS